MNADEVVQFPARAHTEHPGVFWAGDRFEAWCSACGQPRTAWLVMSTAR